MDIVKREQCILKIILKIKKNRNRPCYQNILTLADRGGMDMEMDGVKDILDWMIGKGLIRDNGKEGHESFSVIEEENINNESDDGIEERCIDDEENTSTDNNFNEKNIMSDSLKSYIDDKFYETLINIIKYEVKVAVDTEIHKNMLLSRNPESNELNTVSSAQAIRPTIIILTMHC